MSQYKKLLVVIDPEEDNQKALNRALDLASRSENCQVTLFLTIYDFSYEMTTMLSSNERNSMRNAVIQDRKDWLQALIDEAQYSSQLIDTHVAWHNRPYESIIRFVNEGNYDMVIKATHEHDILKSVIFTPTDWHLLRKCPCAVLLVKEHDWPDNGHILGAINAGTDNPDHLKLNEEIMMACNQMSRLLNADIYLVNAFPPTPMNVAVEIPEFDVNEYHNSMQAHHKKAIEQFCQTHGVDQQFAFCEEGMPEDVIPNIAEQVDAELVVIGTVGRSGLSAALIGNTAEHVIDNINCDLLALKPPGFETSVK